MHHPQRTPESFHHAHGSPFLGRKAIHHSTSWPPCWQRWEHRLWEVILPEDDASERLLWGEVVSKAYRRPVVGFKSLTWPCLQGLSNMLSLLCTLSLSFKSHSLGRPLLQLPSKCRERKMGLSFCMWSCVCTAAPLIISGDWVMHAFLCWTSKGSILCWSVLATRKDGGSESLWECSEVVMNLLLEVQMETQ